MDQHNSPIKSAYHTFLFGKGGPYVKCTKTSFVPQVTWSPRNCYEDIFCWSHIGIKNFSCKVMILFLEKKKIICTKHLLWGKNCSLLQLSYLK